MRVYKSQESSKPDPNCNFFLELAASVAGLSTCPYCKQGSVIVKGSTVVSSGHLDCAKTSEHGLECSKSPDTCGMCVKSPVNAVVSLPLESSTDCVMYSCAMDVETKKLKSVKLNASEHPIVCLKGAIVHINEAPNLKESDSKNVIVIKLKRKEYSVKNPKTLECPTCGDVFEQSYPRQKYCNHWKIGICESCHKVFQYKCDGKKKPRTCGDRKCVDALRVRIIGNARKKRFESSKES